MAKRGMRKLDRIRERDRLIGRLWFDEELTAKEVITRIVEKGGPILTVYQVYESVRRVRMLRSSM